MKIGVGYRREMSAWIQGRPAGVDVLELTAEHFTARDEPHLRELRNHFQMSVHGLGLSLGTPGPLDERRVEHFAQVARMAAADWVGEHVAFTRTADTDLGHLNPVPPTRENVKLLGDHAREVAARCGRPMLLENITSYLRLDGDLRETEFLNALCAHAGAGLLLDVTNLFINSRNHDFDPVVWLRELDPASIRQMHIVGYARHGHRYVDSHAAPVQEELLELAAEVAAYAAVEVIILERDEDIPGVTGLDAEIRKLERVCGRD